MFSSVLQHYWYCLRYNKTNSFWRYRWLLKIVSHQLGIFPTLGKQFSIVTSMSVTICIKHHANNCRHHEDSNIILISCGLVKLHVASEMSPLHQISSSLKYWRHQTAAASGGRSAGRTESATRLVLSSSVLRNSFSYEPETQTRSVTVYYKQHMTTKVNMWHLSGMTNRCSLRQLGWYFSFLLRFIVSHYWNQEKRRLKTAAMHWKTLSCLTYSHVQAINNEQHLNMNRDVMLWVRESNKACHPCHNLTK